MWDVYMLQTTSICKNYCCLRLFLVGLHMVYTSSLPTTNKYYYVRWKISSSIIKINL